MLPENPLLQLIPARAKTCLGRIQNQIWQNSTALKVDWCGASEQHLDYETAIKRKKQPIDAPFFWGKLYDQAWFRIRIPKAQQDGTWFLEWKEQGESTAYIDGVPYAGLDVAHHQCRIPKGTKEIWMEVMCLESGIWMTNTRPAITSKGCRYEAAKAVHRDALAWEVYHDFDVLLNLLEDEYKRNPSLTTPFGRSVGHLAPFENVSILLRRLCRELDEVINAYERSGLSGAKPYLRAAYQKLVGQSEAIQCQLTGHAHIDLVWLWTEKAAQFKAVHTFATANRLMDEYPEFRFGYSQPASYRAVETRSPKLMQAVRQRIQKGQWEAVGAAEVESDTLIACGEALARSLIVGQEGFVDLQGKPSPIMWLPDVFGYAACLPQILVQTGVDYFFTTKLHWGSITLFPYSSFIWRGPDGSEILSHVSQGMGYNMNVTPAEIRSASREYRQADVHDRFLMPSGYGDGGGGVTDEMCERARRLKDLAGTATTEWGRIDDYFETLENVRDRLPVYRGELYLQYHRGTFTTHGDLKKKFRAAERALQTWEAAHCLSAQGPIERVAWERMVFAQFHDYIPGSSVAEVYAEALPELDALRDKAITSATACLTSQKKATPALFNPLPIEQMAIHGEQFYKLPPLAAVTIDALQAISFAPVKASQRQLSNQRLKARFDNKGQITQLSIDGKDTAIQSPLGALMLYPDQPHAFEAWDIDRSTLANGSLVKAKADIQLTESPTAATLSFTRQLTEKSKVTIHYRLTAISPVLEVTIELNWQDPEYLLKMIFPTGYDGQMARFGGPFGSVLRSQQPGQPYDEAQWEVPGSRWAMLTDDGEQDGLFVVTEAKYGWTARSGTLGLSLVRSARMSTSARASIEEQGSDETPISDLKPHRIQLAIGRFDPEAPREELPAALADRLYTPFISVSTDQSRNCGYLGLSGGDSLLPCWAKPETDDRWVLRLHETLGRRGIADLQLAPGWSYHLVDLSGKPLAQQSKDGTIAFSPYQILSVELRPN